MIITTEDTEEKTQTKDRYRTGSGPGSPRGQPAWGGGCDRNKDSTFAATKIASQIGGFVTKGVSNRNNELSLYSGRYPLGSVPRLCSVLFLSILLQVAYSQPFSKRKICHLSNPITS